MSCIPGRGIWMKEAQTSDMVTKVNVVSMGIVGVYSTNEVAQQQKRV